MSRTDDDSGVPPELVARARAGDTDALEALTTRVYPRVRRWCLVHTGDPVDADDLTQDVLVQILRKLPGFRGDSRFTTWLYTVARHAAVDAHRARARRRRAVDHPDADHGVRPSPPLDPLARLERTRAEALLRGLADALPERQRQVFELAEFQGRPTAEIAAILGIEPVSVRAHLFKARKALRARVLEGHPALVEERP